MSELSKTEVLLIAVTACAMEGKPFNNTRLAVISNALTGKNDSSNAVELRMREFKKRAREVMTALENGTCTVAPATPKSRGKKEAKTPGSDGVKTGRVAKTKTPAKNKNKVKVEEEIEDADLLLEEEENMEE